MKRKHQKTLELIFARPGSGNINWADIESLFVELGAELSEREGSRIGVRLFGEQLPLTAPYPCHRQRSSCQHSEVVARERSRTMVNMMEINGYRAVIQYDPEIEMFRGEFVGLNGGADFYARDIDGLRRKGEMSLKVFLDMCREDGAAPIKEYSGRFNLRVSPRLHAEIAARAMAAGKSLNQWVADALDQSVHTPSGDSNEKWDEFYVRPEAKHLTPQMANEVQEDYRTGQKMAG